MKMQHILTAALAACSLALLTTNAHAQNWGSVEGQFVLDGDVPNLPPTVAKGANVKDAQVCAAQDLPNQTLVVDPQSKGIANIFLYLRKAPSSVHPDAKDPPKEPAVFDQKNCQFIPHALLVRAGQKVLVKSSDPIPHNTHTHPLFNQEDNFIVRPNDQDGVPITYEKSEILPTKVNCDLHPHMEAYWLIVDHPYAAITDEQGKFKIENLPEGEHTFTVWQERVGYLNRAFKVKVKGGSVTQMEPVKVDPAKFGL